MQLLSGSDLEVDHGSITLAGSLQHLMALCPKSLCVRCFGSLFTKHWRHAVRGAGTYLSKRTDLHAVFSVGLRMTSWTGLADAPLWGTTCWPRCRNLQTRLSHRMRRLVGKSTAAVASGGHGFPPESVQGIMRKRVESEYFPGA